MIAKIYNAKANGKVKAITSKSYAHRLMICEYLAYGEVKSSAILSDDILATTKCLSAIKSGAILDAGESGSTLRFLIPVVSALGGEYTFLTHGKLASRPNDELFSALEKHGVNAYRDGDKIKVSGKLTAGEYRLRGDISSQYITGLLLSLPLLDGDSVIVPTTPLVSTPYIEITLEVLKDFGVKIDFKDGKFYIKGNQKFDGKSKIEGDWSNAGFFLTAGAISGEVTVSGLNLNSKQGDKIIVDLIQRAGAKVTVLGDTVTVKKSALNAITFSAEDCPDVVPIASVLCACADGVSVIKDISRLKIKESDRVFSVIELLKTLGVTAKEKENSLLIYGNGGDFSGGTVSSFNDHRIVMASAIAGFLCKEPLIITDAQAVNKSYPTFFEDYILCGGKADVTV